MESPQEQRPDAVFEENKLLTIDFETYAKAQGINSHGLKDILRSPAHYFEHRYGEVERKETPALEFGKLLHFAVLESEMFQDRYIIRPNFDKRTKAGKEGFLEWQANLKPGAIVVPENFVEALTKIAQKVMRHPKAKHILKGGVREQSFFWTDPETGEYSKGRLDFISGRGHIVDLKSTMDARESAFARDIVKHGYHISGAHYTHGAGVAKSLGIDSKTFIFLVVEKNPPYEMAIYPAGTSVLGVGDQWRSKAMQIYSKCKKSGVWPGYNPDMRTIELPQWAEAVYPDDEEA
jgi:PDDEXK-like domain of unknown function (DUF3799)